MKRLASISGLAVVAVALATAAASITSAANAQMHEPAFLLDQLTTLPLPTSLERPLPLVSRSLPLARPSSTGRARATRYDNALIADTALTYVGQWGGLACRDAHRSGYTGSTRVYPVVPRRATDGKVTKEGDGQCRAFVNCIVWMVSGHHQWLGGGGDDYFASFLHPSGGGPAGVEIKNVARLAKGDIVQVGSGAHTYIVVSHIQGTLFTVVDSNNDLRENVLSYNRKIVLGPNVRAFRMGAVKGEPSASDITAPDAHDRAIVQQLLGYTVRETEAIKATYPELEARVKGLLAAAQACVPADDVSQLEAALITLLVSITNIPRWYQAYLARWAAHMRSWHPHQPVFAEWLRLSAHAADLLLLISQKKAVGPGDMCRIITAFINYANNNPNASQEQATIFYLKLIGVSEYNARKFFAEAKALDAAVPAVASQMRVFLAACGLTSEQIALLVPN